MGFLIYNFNKDLLATVASEIMRRVRATSLAVGKVETEALLIEYMDNLTGSGC